MEMSSPAVNSPIRAVEISWIGFNHELLQDGRVDGWE
jgi:hypothetical protein